jgi:hypothetical protein
MKALRRIFMQRSVIYALLAVSLIWAAAQAVAQSAPSAGQTAQQAGPALAPGTVVGAELSKGVDAKKAKVGQEVVAKSLADLRDNNGNVVIPRGAKLVGHVTQVQAASKDQPQSSLAIIFDKVEAKHGKEGKEVALHAGIQALAKPEPSPMTQEQQQSEGPGGAGGQGGAPMGGTQPNMGGGGRTAGGMGGSSMPSQQGQGGNMGGGNTGGPMPQQGGGGGPEINANSHGVIGIPNMTLSPQASPTEGSVISSSRGNVKLDSGTLLVLRVIGQ